VIIAVVITMIAGAFVLLRILGQSRKEFHEYRYLT